MMGSILTAMLAGTSNETKGMCQAWLAGRLLQ